MNATRRARLQAVIQEELAQFISREIKDPRIPMGLIVTQVEVATDGSHAKVSVSTLMGSAGNSELTREEVKDCLAGLTSASGFMRRHLAKVLTIRHIPNLVFNFDRGVENTVRVHELLKQIQGSGNKSEE